MNENDNAAEFLLHPPQSDPPVDWLERAKWYFEDQAGGDQRALAAATIAIAERLDALIEQCHGTL